MRVFFGLELDATTALQVADWRDRQLACAGQPVPPANFHITLAFIGPLREPAIERLCLAVDEWLARSAVTGATLHLDRTGYWHKPGIYWLGPTTWPEHLARLAQKLNSLASAVGCQTGQESVPAAHHAVSSLHCSATGTSLAPSIDMTYRHCALFESRQGKQGVSYHVLQDWDLPPAID